MSVPCKHCGNPSGISAAVLKANGASSVICAACAQKNKPVDP